jgi:hypothetical protein
VNSRRKIGRNEPCHCGSGKKFKKCHGAVSSDPQPLPMPADMADRVRLAIAQHQAKEKQRQDQQGLGRPIISTELNGIRVVAVGNTVMYSAKWKTVFDFLGDYLRAKLGESWGNAELAKPLPQRHPVLVWYDRVCRLQQETIKVPGQVHDAPMTGAAAAWFNLAYDLYCLEHNAKLQSKLIDRLRNTDLFAGARYEVFVAGTLSRAGFEIEFEDEDDRGSTHVEFTATCKASGKKYSVEAKQRNTGTEPTNHRRQFRLGRLLQKALKKNANFPRIVFLGIDVPDVLRGDVAEIPSYLARALADLRRFEGRLLNGSPLPPAYLVVTNRPYDHNLDNPDTRCSALFEGFQIPDFKNDVGFPSLRDAHRARLAHADLHQLMASMRQHSEIPVTFDGQAPELAFGAQQPRLTVGEFYMVSDSEGKQQRGRLMQAVVLETSAMGIYALDNGQLIIAPTPLTEAEVAAHKRHPDTFFGVHHKVSGSAKTPLDWFDFFLDGYRETPRERLLEFMAAAPDHRELSRLSREDLLEIYAERCAYGVLQQAQGQAGVRPAPPPP